MLAEGILYQLHYPVATERGNAVDRAISVVGC